MSSHASGPGPGHLLDGEAPFPYHANRWEIVHSPCSREYAALAREPFRYLFTETLNPGKYQYRSVRHAGSQDYLLEVARCHIARFPIFPA